MTDSIPAGQTVRSGPIDVDNRLQVRGTLAVGEWSVAGVRISGVQTLSVRPTDVSVTFTVPRNEVSTWRQYQRAGDIRTEEGAAGRFRTFDEAGRASPVSLSPAPWFSPPLSDISGYVINYGEEQVSPTTTQVSLTIQRLTNRDSQFTPVSQSGGPYEVRVADGSLSLTESQVSTASTQGATSGRQLSVALTLSPEQAATLLDNVGFPAAVQDRPIDEGRDELLDTTPSDRQTVRIDAPSEALLGSGDFLVQGWSLATAGFDERRRYRVDLDLAHLRDDSITRTNDSLSVSADTSTGAALVTDRDASVSQSRDTTLSTPRRR